jgi:hypothetical protein
LSGKASIHCLGFQAPCLFETIVRNALQYLCDPAVTNGTSALIILFRPLAVSSSLRHSAVCRPLWALHRRKEWVTASGDLTNPANARSAVATRVQPRQPIQLGSLQRKPADYQVLHGLAILAGRSWAQVG